MTPDQFRTQQNQINRVIASQALLLLRRSNPTTERQWDAVAALLFRLIVGARPQSLRLADSYYSSLAPTGRMPRVPSLAYDESMTRKALQRVEKPWTEATAPERANLAARGAAIAVRHVEQAGREAVVQATREDNVRFARYDPRPPCCSFCVLMISRGPVYHSEKSGGFLAHDYDTCAPVPVFPGRDWPGRAQYEAAEAFYIQHAAGASDQRNALRRAIDEQGSPI